MEYFKWDEQSGRLYFDIGPQLQSKQQETDAELMLEQDIGIKMLFHNHIQGIVPINCQHIDEVLRMYYETDGMQTLEQRYHGETITVKTAVQILLSLFRALQSTEPYFINKEGLVLSEECVFLGGGGKQVWLCYYPLAHSDVYDGLKRVTEFLLQHIEHTDKEETAFFYGLYDMIAERSVTIEELAEHLERKETLQNKLKEKQVKRGGNSRGRGRESELKHRPHSYFLVRKAVRDKNLLISLAVPEEIPLQESTLRVGRQRGQDISLVPSQISREHAVIYREGETFQIEDKNSRNGTYVNGRRIAAYVKVPCAPGDVITFADIPYELVKGRA